jgi:methyl-accepting chemotaxis protein
MKKTIIGIRNNVRLGRVTQIGFGTVITLMIGIGIVAKVSMNTLVQATNWVTHTFEVKEQLRQIEKSLVDAETGQRGFIYTREEDFLEPYTHALEALGVSFSDLRLLIGDNREQLQKLDRVEELTQQKLDELAETIALKRSGQEQAAREVVLSRRGKSIMDDLRVQLNEMIQTENRLLETRQQDAAQVEYLSTFVSIVGTVIAILLGLATLVLIVRKVVRPISEVTNVIASSSSEIAATIEQQEQTAAQQAVSVSQTTSTMNELEASSRQSAEQAEVAAAAAKQVSELALAGTKAVEHTLDDMAILKQKVEAIADHILRLSEQTNQISSITELVSDLAKQTNMLALNAAVEAARAGENGKGFAVVATEIRKLADQSKKSTEKINGLIGDIQSAINSSVVATDEGTQTVVQGVRTAQGTADTFMNVIEAIDSIVISSQQISFAAKQQAIATQQVVGAMHALNQGAQQTANGISQTRIGTQRLNEAALNLQAVV